MSEATPYTAGQLDGQVLAHELAVDQRDAAITRAVLRCRGPDRFDQLVDGRIDVRQQAVHVDFAMAMEAACGGV